MAKAKSKSTAKGANKQPKGKEPDLVPPPPVAGWKPNILVGGTSKSSGTVADQEPTEKDRERMAGFVTQPGGETKQASKVK